MENHKETIEKFFQIAEKIREELQPEAEKLESKMGNCGQRGRPTNAALYIINHLKSDLNSAAIEIADINFLMEKTIKAVEWFISPAGTKEDLASPENQIAIEFREKLLEALPEITKR